MKRIYSAVFAGLLLMAGAQAARSQKTVGNDNELAKNETTETPTKTESTKPKKDPKKPAETTPPTSEAKPPDPNQECKLCRWIDLETATVATRFRWVQSNGEVTKSMLKAQPYLTLGEKIQINQQQQQQIYEFNFKFDEAGRYKIHTRLSSGRWFTRSFAETGLGDQFNGEKTWKVYPRQFYLSAQPVKGLEIQYGGIDINRGESTENTTFDVDGWLTGERIKIKRPDKLWFSEISVTYAYFGRFYEPNFFRRAQYLGKSNYHQFLLGKKFNNRVSASVAYSSEITINHLREGIVVKTPELKIVDSIRFDAYHRLEDYRGVKHSSGYNIQVEKTIGKLWLQAGLANEDYRYNVLTWEDYSYLKKNYIQAAGTLTADRMIRGMSPFVSWRYRINPMFSIFGFAVTDIAKPTPLPFVYNADHLSVGFQFDLKAALRKTKLL